MSIAVIIISGDSFMCEIRLKLLEEVVGGFNLKTTAKSALKYAKENKLKTLGLVIAGTYAVTLVGSFMTMLTINIASDSPEYNTVYRGAGRFFDTLTGFQGLKVILQDDDAVRAIWKKKKTNPMNELSIVNLRSRHNSAKSTEKIDDVD